MSIAILGYGNLGKAVEKAIQSDCQFDLVGIFSRRVLDHPLYFDVNTLYQFADKIDVVVVCTASLDETQEKVASLAGKFNTVDCYDVHSKIEKYYQDIDCLALVIRYRGSADDASLRSRPGP